jgi:hypothetical protein
MQGLLALQKVLTAETSEPVVPHRNGVRNGVAVAV